MHYHLDRFHSDAKTARLDSDSSPKIEKFTISRRPMSKDRHNKITEMIANFIALDMRPIGIVEVS